MCDPVKYPLKGKALRYSNAFVKACRDKEDDKTYSESCIEDFRLTHEENHFPLFELTNREAV